MVREAPMSCHRRVPGVALGPPMAAPPTQRPARAPRAKEEGPAPIRSEKFSRSSGSLCSCRLLFP
eukprot:44180-Pyramimonas_sp.AAC.1